jgi:hypothetical protein
VSDAYWPKSAGNYKVAWRPRWFRADQAYVWHNVPWIHFPIAKIDVADEETCVKIVWSLAAGDNLESVVARYREARK